MSDSPRDVVVINLFGLLYSGMHSFRVLRCLNALQIDWLLFIAN